MQSNDEAEKVIICDHFAMGYHLRVKLDEFSVKQASPSLFHELKQTLYSAVADIEDMPLAVSAFTQVVNVARLMGCKSKKMLLGRIDGCYRDYEQALNELVAAKTRLKQLYHDRQIPVAKAHELQTYLTYVERADGKHHRYLCRFEHMLLITATMQEKVAKLNRAILYFTDAEEAIYTHHSLSEKSIDPFQNRLRF